MHPARLHPHIETINGVRYDMDTRCEIDSPSSVEARNAAISELQELARTIQASERAIEHLRVQMIGEPVCADLCKARDMAAALLPALFIQMRRAGMDLTDLQRARDTAAARATNAELRSALSKALGQ